MIFIYSIRVQFHSFTCEYSIFLTAFIEETIFPHCKFLAPLLISWPYMHGFLSGISIRFHWSMSVFMPLSSCFDYCHFVIYFEIRECNTSSFVLLAQSAFSYSRFFVVPNEFQDCFFYFCKKNGNMDALTILILPINEHEMPFH